MQAILFSMSTKLNGSKYCCVLLTIQLNISHFFCTPLNDQTVLFQTIQFSISTQFFVYTQPNVKTVLFQAIQFSMSTQFKCQIVLFDPLIGPYQGQSGLGNNGNERVLCIPQSSSITEASSTDGFVSYPGHSLRKSYPSAGMQLFYFVIFHHFLEIIIWLTKCKEQTYSPFLYYCFIKIVIYYILLSYYCFIKIQWNYCYLIVVIYKAFASSGILSSSCFLYLPFLSGYPFQNQTGSLLFHFGFPNRN